MKFLYVLALAALGATLPMPQRPGAAINMPGSQEWQAGNSLITIGGSSEASSQSGDTSSASTSSCGLLSCASSAGSSGPDSSSSSSSSSAGDLSIDTLLDPVLGNDSSSSGIIDSVNGDGAQ